MLFTETHSPARQLVLFPSAECESPEMALVQPPLPAEMLKVFEEITGWVVGFSESKTSLQNRQLPSPVHGTFSIVDMSAQWPARKPTAHRAKCDQIVSHLDALVSELQETKSKLEETQSLLEAHSPGSVEDDEAVLFDCFVPRYQDDNWDAEWDSDFEINEGLLDNSSNHSTRAVDPPFEGWRMGGSAGLVAGHYVEWKLSDDEQINLIVGQTSTLEEAKDSEAILTVDPLTHEYFLSGDEGFDFLLYDQKTSKLSLIEPSAKYRQLKSSQLIILSTSHELKRWTDSDRNLILPGDPGSVSAQLSKLIGEEEHLLILKRG